MSGAILASYFVLPMTPIENTDRRLPENLADAGVYSGANKITRPDCKGWHIGIIEVDNFILRGTLPGMPRR
jgi:hypothetical protein